MEVGVHHRVEICDVRSFYVVEDDRAGGAHERVDRGTVTQLCAQALEARGIAEIARSMVRGGVLGAFLGDAHELVDTSSDEEQLETFLRQLQRDRSSDPAAGTGHDGASTDHHVTSD